MVEERKPIREKLTATEVEERNRILQRLQQTGELERLRNSLFAKLILQESWREEVKQSTSLAVKESGGISEITMDVLVHKLLPVAKSHTPATIEHETKEEIQQACRAILR